MRRLVAGTVILLFIILKSSQSLAGYDFIVVEPAAAEYSPGEEITFHFAFYFIQMGITCATISGSVYNESGGLIDAATQGIASDGSYHLYAYANAPSGYGVHIFEMMFHVQLCPGWQFSDGSTSISYSEDILIEIAGSATNSDVESDIDLYDEDIWEEIGDGDDVFEVGERICFEIELENDSSSDSYDIDAVYTYSSGADVDWNDDDCGVDFTLSELDEDWVDDDFCFTARELGRVKVEIYVKLEGAATLYNVDSFHIDIVCQPSWSCTNWSSCANCFQTRVCTDSHNCGTTSGKPAESQSCGIFPNQCDPFGSLCDGNVAYDCLYDSYNCYYYKSNQQTCLYGCSFGECASATECAYTDCYLDDLWCHNSAGIRTYIGQDCGALQEVEYEFICDGIERWAIAHETNRGCQSGQCYVSLHDSSYYLETCSQQCANGQCVNPDCLYTACLNNDLWCYNSANQPQYLAEDCGNASGTSTISAVYCSETGDLVKLKSYSTRCCANGACGWCFQYNYEQVQVECPAGCDPDTDQCLACVPAFDCYQAQVCLSDDTQEYQCDDLLCGQPSYTEIRPCQYCDEKCALGESYCAGNTAFTCVSVGGCDTDWQSAFCGYSEEIEGEPYCSGNNVMKDTTATDRWCADGACQQEISINAEAIADCGVDTSFSTMPYCLNDDVVFDDVEIFRGCSSGSCYEDETSESQILMACGEDTTISGVKSCNSDGNATFGDIHIVRGCENAQCHEYPIQDYFAEFVCPCGCDDGDCLPCDGCDYLDCGTSEFHSTLPYCHQGKVVFDNINIERGCADSACFAVDNSQYYQLLDDCGTDEINTNVAFCRDGNIAVGNSGYIRGCSDAQCYEESIDYVAFIILCECGCSEAACLPCYEACVSLRCNPEDGNVWCYDSWGQATSLETDCAQNEVCLGGIEYDAECVELIAPVCDQFGVGIDQTIYRAADRFPLTRTLTLELKGFFVYDVDHFEWFIDGGLIPDITFVPDYEFTFNDYGQYVYFVRIVHKENSCITEGFININVVKPYELFDIFDLDVIFENQEQGKHIISLELPSHDFVVFKVNGGAGPFTLSCFYDMGNPDPIEIYAAKDLGNVYYLFNQGTHIPCYSGNTLYLDEGIWHVRIETGEVINNIITLESSFHLDHERYATQKYRKGRFYWGALSGVCENDSDVFCTTGDILNLPAGFIPVVGDSIDVFQAIINMGIYAQKELDLNIIRLNSDSEKQEFLQAGAFASIAALTPFITNKMVRFVADGNLLNLVKNEKGTRGAIDYISYQQVAARGSLRIDNNEFHQDILSSEYNSFSLKLKTFSDGVDPLFKFDESLKEIMDEIDEAVIDVKQQIKNSNDLPRIQEHILQEFGEEVDIDHVPATDLIRYYDTDPELTLSGTLSEDVAYIREGIASLFARATANQADMILKPAGAFERIDNVYVLFPSKSNLNQVFPLQVGIKTPYDPVIVRKEHAGRYIDLETGFVYVEGINTFITKEIDFVAEIEGTNEIIAFEFKWGRSDDKQAARTFATLKKLFPDKKINVINNANLRDPTLTGNRLWAESNIDSDYVIYTNDPSSITPTADFQINTPFEIFCENGQNLVPIRITATKLIDSLWCVNQESQQRYDQFYEKEGEYVLAVAPADPYGMVAYSCQATSADGDQASDVVTLIGSKIHIPEDEDANHRFVMAIAPRFPLAGEKIEIEIYSLDKSCLTDVDCQISGAAISDKRMKVRLKVDDIEFQHDGQVTYDFLDCREYDFMFNMIKSGPNIVSCTGRFLDGYSLTLEEEVNVPVDQIQRVHKSSCQVGQGVGQPLWLTLLALWLLPRRRKSKI
ncbi:MAG: hypothetical protein ACOZBH_03150 [Patescibacteria group bacterium]